MPGLAALVCGLLVCAPVIRANGDPQRLPGAPNGTITPGTATSKLHPGVPRNYWIYVPAQHTAAKPSCVMVFPEGAAMVEETGEWRVPIVLDNLIHQGRMPPVIGIFIDSGILIDEILPEVAGRYNLSKDPNDYAIAGSNAAFPAAWSRPDTFHRVISFTGSDAFPPLIRKTEPKPLRVFLQDQDTNQDVFAALQDAGYESAMAKGRGGALFSDALRWIWKDYPKPVKRSAKLTEGGPYSIVAPGQSWELLGRGYQLTADTAVDRAGNIFFTDARNNRIYKVDSGGRIVLWKEASGGAHGIVSGPDGRLYAGQHDRKRIVALASDGRESVLAEGVQTHHLAVTARNEIYFADAPHHIVWLLDAAGKQRAVSGEVNWPHCLRISTDQSLLAVTDSRTRWVWQFQIRSDGSLAGGRPFYRLESPEESSDADAGGMTYDTAGKLYIATNLGVQVFDRLGRLMAILNLPEHEGLSDVFFAGPKMDWLYITDGDKLYRRPSKRRGAPAWPPARQQSSPW